MLSSPFAQHGDLPTMTTTRMANDDQTTAKWSFMSLGAGSVHRYSKCSSSSSAASNRATCQTKSLGKQLGRVGSMLVENAKWKKWRTHFVAISSALDANDAPQTAPVWQTALC